MKAIISLVLATTLTNFAYAQCNISVNNTSTATNEQKEDCSCKVPKTIVKWRTQTNTKYVHVLKKCKAKRKVVYKTKVKVRTVKEKANKTSISILAGASLGLYQVTHDKDNYFVKEKHKEDFGLMLQHSVGNVRFSVIGTSNESAYVGIGLEF
jgi:maltose-binding protein MalE